MKWQEFYDKSDLWQDIGSCLPELQSLEELGPADEVISCFDWLEGEEAAILLDLISAFQIELSFEQVAEINDMIDIDETQQEKLVLQAIYHNMPIAADEILEYSQALGKPAFTRILRYGFSKNIQYTSEQREELYDFLRDDPLLLEVLQDELRRGEKLTGEKLLMLTDFLRNEDYDALITYVIQQNMTFSAKTLMELADRIFETKTVDRLFDLALYSGTAFTCKQITELQYLNVSDEMVGKAALCSSKQGMRYSVKQIIELADLVDESVLAQILENEMTQGIELSSKDVVGIIGTCNVSEEMATRLVKYARDKGVCFTAKELDKLDGCVDDAFLRQLDKEQGTSAFAEEKDEDAEDDADPGEDDDDREECEEEEDEIEEHEQEELIEGATSEDTDFLEDYGVHIDNTKKPGILDHLGVFFLGRQVDKHIRNKELMKKCKYRVGDRVYLRFHSAQEGTVTGIIGEKKYRVHLDNGVDKNFNESDLETPYFH
ncbi:MAG: hypothetical protein J5379_09990 [Clostridiales bacterium]|nr:hypothetical protein [Clostridiales bacterium]